MLPAILAGAGFLLDAAGAVSEHKAQKKRHRENAAAARRSREREMKALSIRQIQENTAARAEQSQVRREAEKAAGSAQATAAASGIAGMGLDVLLGDLEAERGRALQIIEENRLMDLDQLGREREAAVEREQARRRQVSKPNPWATGLAIGAAGLNAAERHRRLTREPAGVD